MNSFRDRLRNSITAEETEVSTTVEIPEAPPKTNQEYEIVSVNDISPHPQNARKGNINAIRESIKTPKWIKKKDSSNARNVKKMYFLVIVRVITNMFYIY